MSLIQNHPRFKQDFETFKSKIELLENENDRLEADKLLKDLVITVKKMDNMYLDMVYSRQLSSLGNELRDKINDIRRQLTNKLKVVK